MNSGINVNVYTISEGLKEYQGIKIIRLKSLDYNLLIMQDYQPIIGEIDGSINFESDDLHLDFDKIKAFYVCRNNVFDLIVRENYD